MKIRRSILNMSLPMWNKLDYLFGRPNTFIDNRGITQIEEMIIDCSPKYMLDNVGLISAMSAKLNEEEEKFIKIMYRLNHDNK